MTIPSGIARSDDVPPGTARTDVFGGDCYVETETAPPVQADPLYRHDALPEGGTSTGLGLHVPQDGQFPDMRLMHTDVTQYDNGVPRAMGTQMTGLDWDPAKTGESGFWGGAYGPTVKANTDVSDNGVNIGYQANSVSGAVGYRNVGESDHDRGLRVGLGTGGVVPGFGVAGIRGSVTDVDGDGRQEVNTGVSIPLGLFGIPAGLSVDRSTETPMGDALSEALLAPMLAPLGPLAALAVNPVMDAVGLGDYAPGTLLGNLFGE